MRISIIVTATLVLSAAAYHLPRRRVFAWPASGARRALPIAPSVMNAEPLAIRGGGERHG
jgi:hypothetical protein